MAALGRILCELFADLTVDLIPETREATAELNLRSKAHGWNKLLDYPIRLYGALLAAANVASGLHPAAETRSLKNIVSLMVSSSLVWVFD